MDILGCRHLRHEYTLGIRRYRDIFVSYLARRVYLSPHTSYTNTHAQTLMSSELMYSHKLMPSQKLMSSDFMFSQKLISRASSSERSISSSIACSGGRVRGSTGIY
jgi:hypothetical protein